MSSNKKLLLFDVQRFSIHDGTGIRTTLFTKGCPLQCVWCQNPESQKIKPEIAYYFESCIKCNLCIDICPNNAIDSTTYISDYEKCNACGKCIEVCNTNSRRLIGKSYDTEEIISLALKDVDFYKTSNGGITITGGEPFMFPEKLEEILKQLKSQNLNINIETAGFFNLDKVKLLLKYIDSIFFDIKLIDQEKHKYFTGVSNDKIIKNFEYLVANFSNITPRMPIIPDVNDSENCIRSVATFLNKNNCKEIHLLPFNTLGNSKIERIDTSAKVYKKDFLSTSKLNEIQRIFNTYNINTYLYE